MSPRRLLAEHTSYELSQWQAFFAVESREREERRAGKKPPPKPQNLKDKVRAVMGALQQRFA